MNSSQRRERCVFLKPFDHSLLRGLLCLCLAAGCASPKAYVLQGHDFSRVSDLAVLPFQSRSLYYDGAAVTDAFYSHIAEKKGRLILLTREETDRALSDLKITNTNLTNEDLKAFGQKTGVDTVVIGLVEATGQQWGKQVPDLLLNVRVVDVDSGKIIWNLRDDSRWSMVTSVSIHIDSVTKRIASIFQQSLPAE